MLWKGSQFFSKRGTHAISAIVIHYISAIFTKPNAPYDIENIIGVLEKVNLSYHFVVTREGDIYQLVKEGNMAWHAGKSRLHGRPNCNFYSIGLAFAGEKGVPYTNEQYFSSAKLCAKLCRDYEIPLNRVVGHDMVSHRYVRDPPKTDPGKKFKWQMWLQQIASLND